MTLHHLKRFGGLVLALGVALTACSSDPQRQQVVNGFFRKSAPPTPAPQFVALSQTGAPSYIVSVEQRENAYAQFMFQQENARGDETWISGDHVALGMKDGIVTSTRGLGGDLMSSDVSRLLPRVLGRQEGITELFQTHLSPNDETIILAFRCRLTNRGARDIDLQTYVSQTQLMVADCQNGAHRIRNLYWVEERSGKIVQSKQWISPFLGTLALRLIPTQG